MKRYGKLWDSFISKDNFDLALKLTCKKRKSRRDVQKFLKDKDKNLEDLRQEVITGKYKISRYSTKLIKENTKPRIIYILPLKDRIVQHALINIIEPIFVKKFIKNTFGCIEGRGPLRGSLLVRNNINKYKYCLKTDIRKFYPTMNHDILYNEICKVIKDKKLLEIIRDIVYSVKGEVNCPIGNLTSQLFGNIYLNVLDKYVVHVIKPNFYCRYCDDCVFMGSSVEQLQDIKASLIKLLHDRLRQELSYCEIFNLSQGIDFLGYRHFKSYTKLRKRTYLKFKRAIARMRTSKDKRALLQKLSTISSFVGMAKYCDCIKLIKDLELPNLIKDMTIKEFKEVGPSPDLPLTGKKVSILNLFDKPIIITAWKLLNIDDRETVKIQFSRPNADDTVYVTFTSSKSIKEQLQGLDSNNLPVRATIRKDGEAFYLE